MSIFNGSTSFAIPLGTHRFRVFHTRDSRFPPTDEPLGDQELAGLRTVGHRVVSETLGISGIVTELWESPGLQIVVSSRTTVPELADLDYRITNISRAEPAASLFVIPPDYSLVQTSSEDPWMVLENGTRQLADRR
jgi:hypothetical protein